MSFVREFKDLRIYRLAFDGAMRIFEISKEWPREEQFALTGQIRRSSRSICGNLAEAWRKRLYVAAFVSKLSDANAEAAETQVWLDFAVHCRYLDAKPHAELGQAYAQISGGLIKMIADPDPWCGPAALRELGGLYRLSGVKGVEGEENL